MLKFLSGLKQNIYPIAISMVLVGLPLSLALMSMGTIVLFAWWLIEGNFKDKWNRLKSRKVLWAVLSLYGFCLLSLLWTEDFDYALHDLRIKLPLLVFPLVLGTIPMFTEQRMRVLGLVFISGVTISGLISAVSFLGLLSEPMVETKHHVPFVSHIRYSLMICFSLVVMGYYFTKVNKRWKVVFALASAFLVFVMIIIHTATGVVVLTAAAILSGVYALFRLRNKSLKRILFGAVVVFVVLVGSYTAMVVNDHFVVKEDISDLPKFSAGGEFYNHNPENLQLENGYYVWMNIAWEELERTWNERSEVKFRDEDGKGQMAYGTLIRYLTSKGLRKDAEGVAALTAEDIQRIESGISTIRDMEGNAFTRRMDAILFEIDAYRYDNNPSGNSVTQRLEFWKVGVDIVKSEPWLGVGIGDVANAYKNQYDLMDSRLEPEYRLRAHNQYLTFTITLGFLGGLWFVFTIIYPLFHRPYHTYLYVAFFAILALSFVSEDTLETQAGVTFFGLLNALLLFSRKHLPFQKLDEPPDQA